MRIKLEKAQEKKKKLISNSDSKEKNYQAYLENLKLWNKERADIEGEKEDFNFNSINGLKNRLNYITYKLDEDYNKAILKRNELIREIFKQKQKITEVYKSLYEPIDNEIQGLLNDTEDKIKFDVDLVLTDKSIDKTLLDYISAVPKGVFQGKTEQVVKMKSMISSTNFNNVESVLNFISSVYECINEDYDNVDKKIKNRLKFYNTLTQIDFIDAEFYLKMGERKLEELSPGERGMVLLVFYLALSKNKTPLIIDQPEDNLDNQSVYNKLVPCILEAKNKRQVIIVTHNPNIAVACDADQIITCNMDKNNNIITYKSGGIESIETRNNVVDILEGTIPAFDLRRRKYKEDLKISNEL